jgi:hypothetical protein
MHLPCREVENLLPTNLLLDAIEWDGSRPQARESVLRSIQIQGEFPDAYAHADLKDGVTLCHVSAMPPSPRKDFWRERADEVRAICGFHEVCIDTFSCAGKADRCAIFKGWGNGLLALLLSYMGTISEAKQLERVKTSPTRDAWLGLGEAAFQWGIAPERRRS